MNNHLFEDFFEDCTLLDKTSESDGQGGFVYKWVDGAKFRAAVTKNNTLDAKVAEKSGVTEIYTITVAKGTPLQYHDIVRRDSDGSVFRVTSNIKDSETPKRASFQIGTVSAEKWRLE